jgi:hypothetical protein
MKREERASTWLGAELKGNKEEKEGKSIGITRYMLRELEESKRRQRQ